MFHLKTYLILITMLSNCVASSNELLFVSNQDGDREIYTVKYNGKDLRQLTHNKKDDYMATWSPDGKLIAFVSHRSDGNGDIYIMNTDGSNQRNISNSVGIDSVPQWSPDGKNLVFTSSRNSYGGTNIFTANIKNMAIKQITMGTAIVNSPRWSPDGKWIAYQEFDNRNKSGIRLISPDGSKSKVITKTSKKDDRAVSWSPDSSQLLYASRRQRKMNIYTYKIHTDQEKQITHLDTVDHLPTWSKDGKQILFLSARDSGDKPETFIMNADGSSPKNKSNLGVLDDSASWSNNGKGILISSYNGTRYSNIYYIKSGSNKRFIVTNADAYQSQPMARPTLTVEHVVTIDE